MQSLNYLVHKFVNFVKNKQNCKILFSVKASLTTGDPFLTTLLDEVGFLVTFDDLS